MMMMMMMMMLMMMVDHHEKYLLGFVHHTGNLRSGRAAQRPRAPAAGSPGPLASMAAAALEAWTVEDGFLMASACEAQDRLAEVLECEFTRPAYQPPWVSYVTAQLTPQP
jgi:hypothetical protein